LLEAWARNGLTDEQIAHNMGITAKTLYEWKNKYSDICESLKRGKEVVDILVENALLKRALGYTYEETSNKYECGVLTERKVTTKEVVPDTTAQIFWLKNRNPEAWRDRREVESKVDFESDNFIEALKGQVKDTFADAGGIVEE
jgi:transcriptional regulator with XRE-family HTH domain